MKIIVYSLTGNCKRFVDMCEIPKEDVIYLQDIDYDVDFDYILITPTFGFGEVPVAVASFLEENHNHLKGHKHIAVWRSDVYTEGTDFLHYTESRHRVDKFHFSEFARRKSNKIN